VVAMTVVLEELSRWSLSLATVFNMSANYGAINIVECGTEEQKQRFLPGLMKGETLFAFGLSEPDVGADLADVKTTTVRRGDKLIVKGAKRWTTGASIADYVYALVKTGPPENRRRNLSFVVVPTDAPGVTVLPLPVMGSHAVQTNDVVFEDVEVPIENLIGGEAGWNNAWSMLAGPSLEIEKLVPTAIALGTAVAAVEEAWECRANKPRDGEDASIRTSQWLVMTSGV
jgi:alkylation response protein AidB-like acyl-CoA dehydrogenase